MGRRRKRKATSSASPCEYESLRKARMLENQARLDSLGLLKTVSQLRQQAQSVKPKKPSYQKRLYGLTPLRRSQRIKATSTSNSNHDNNGLTLPKRPDKVASSEGEEEEEENEIRPANAPLIKIRVEELQILQEASARRCNSKGRGSVYNPILGICCHFCSYVGDIAKPNTKCRQKKLCGEEDCKRCGNFDVAEPCLGKTDCSVCHSSNGVFCRACLKVRYGEEIEEVRQNKEWMCPHCIEAKGINPYWICNSSLCLKRRNIPPTGLAIFKAREMGYKSVAHLLMEELKRGKKYKG